MTITAVTLVPSRRLTSRARSSRDVRARHQAEPEREKQIYAVDGHPSRRASRARQPLLMIRRDTHMTIKSPISLSRTLLIINDGSCAHDSAIGPDHRRTVRWSASPKARGGDAALSVECPPQ